MPIDVPNDSPSVTDSADAGHNSVADLADPLERAVAAETARRHARWVVGAALERLKRGPETDADARDWSLAHGCAATPEAFAETHGQLSPRESAAARAFARAKRDWPGFADALARGAIPVDCVDQLVAVATPATIAEWVVRAERDPADFRRRLRRARVGQAPAQVDIRRRRVDFGFHSDGSFEAATTLRFSPLQHFDVWHARYRLSAREKMPLSIGEMLPLLVADLAIERRNGSIPRGPDAARGPRIVFLDPIRRVAWVQTNRGWFRIRPRDLPRFRRGRRVRVEVLDFEGAPVDPVSYETLAAAFPAIAEPGAAPIPSPGTRVGGRLDGRPPARPQAPDLRSAAWIESTPDPATHLATLSALAADLPTAWGPDACRAAGGAGARVEPQFRAIVIDAVARVADEIHAGTRPAEDWARLATRLGWSARTLDDAVALGRRLRELPAVHHAFRAGELGYAKVRALARVATAATEAGWLALALVHDTAALEAWSRSVAARS